MEEALQFSQFINSNVMGLQFTYNHEPYTINFLDVTLVGDCNKGVLIKPFRKSTATNSVLLATSSHPAHVTKNLPVGELIRIKRKSSSVESYELAKQDTLMRLKNRLYPKWTLDRAEDKVVKMPRQNLICTKTKMSQKQENRTITFCTGYSPQYRQIVKIVKKHLPVINHNDNLRQILRNGVQLILKKHRP